MPAMRAFVRSFPLSYSSAHSMRLLSRVGEVKAQWFKSRDELVASLPQCKVLAVRVETIVDEAMINAAPELRVVISGTTGVNHIDKKSLERRGIPLFYLHGEHTRPTAEHAFALLMALARNLRPAHNSVQEGEWIRQRYIGRELAGLTLGIVGIGRIGGEISKIATGFGMHTIAYDPYLTRSEIEAKKSEKVDSLMTLFKRSNAVTLHCPLTDETRGMVAGPELAALEKGGYFVNAARGAIVDIPSLVAEVASGRISAAVDVYDPEPPTRDELLLSAARQYQNLMLTPHLGASTWQAVERASTSLAKQTLQHLGLPVD